jgi:hypothetical protein
MSFWCKIGFHKRDQITIESYFFGSFTQWRNVTTKLVQLKYSRQVEILMSSRRPDVDIYFDDQDGKRHFLVRNHESKTPWQDAFGVLREAVRDNQKLTVRKKDNSRIGKALFKS